MNFQWNIKGKLVQPGRLFCIGKNYSAHVREMNDPVPDHPVVFMKPAQSLHPEGHPIPFPSHGKILHHEAEVVVLLAQGGKAIPEEEAMSLVGGMALGLDLTLRDLQSQFKKSGMPWELAKSFEHSAPLGTMEPWNPSTDPGSIHFECRVNGQLRQTGHTGDMLYPIPKIIHYLSGVWTLQAGDLIFTGTPSGVGPLNPGDRIRLESDHLPVCEWEMDPTI